MGYRPRQSGRRRCAGAAAVWAAACIALGGCGVPRVEPIDHLRGEGLDQPFPGASMARFDAPFEQLDLAVPVAFKKQHWGLIRVQREPAAGGADELPQGVLRAAALLPDGRTAQVVGWPVGRSKLAVAARVGHFGDRGQERSFLELLAKVFRTRLTRRPRFELPDPAQGG